MDDIRLYSSLETKKTYLEFWGASTKHPDIAYCYQSDIERECFDENTLITKDGYSCFQWIIYCLSRMTFHTRYYLSRLLEMVEPIYGDNYFL